MSKVIHTMNAEYNFWEIYPALKKVEEFKYIQKEYKARSSDVMWFIVYAFDLDSVFINLPIEERTDLLSKDILKDKNWYRQNSSRIEKAIVIFENLVDSVASRQLRQLIETMEKRTIFLREAKYDLENYDKLDKMAANTASLFKVLEVIEKQLSKEKGTGATKGGHQTSLVDADEI